MDYAYAYAYHYIVYTVYWLKHYSVQHTGNFTVSYVVLRMEMKAILLYWLKKYHIEGIFKPLNFLYKIKTNL